MMIIESLYSLQALSVPYFAIHRICTARLYAMNVSLFLGISLYISLGLLDICQFMYSILVRAPLEDPNETFDFYQGEHELPYRETNKS